MWVVLTARNGTKQLFNMNKYERMFWGVPGYRHEDDGKNVECTSLCSETDSVYVMETPEQIQALIDAESVRVHKLLVQAEEDLLTRVEVFNER